MKSVCKVTLNRGHERGSFLPQIASLRIEQSVWKSLKWRSSPSVIKGKTLFLITFYKLMTLLFKFVHFRRNLTVEKVFHFLFQWCVKAILHWKKSSFLKKMQQKWCSYRRFLLAKTICRKKTYLTQNLKVLEIKCRFFLKYSFFDSFDTFCSKLLWKSLFKTLENHAFCKELSNHAPTDDPEQGPNRCNFIFGTVT